MKLLCHLFSFLCCFLILHAEEEDCSKKQMTQLAEAFGHFIGKNLEVPGIKFDIEAVIRGLKDQSLGKSSPLSEEEYEEMMETLQQKAFCEMCKNNLSQANTFMAENVKDKDIRIIEEGKLHYQVVNSGVGEVVEDKSTPTIHYEGKYLDGTVFSTSKDGGDPISIPLEQAIAGFGKGIIGMREGEKRKIFVHPDCGYGINGPLQPNSLLIFEVEVLKAQTAADDQVIAIDEKNSSS